MTEGNTQMNALIVVGVDGSPDAAKALEYAAADAARRGATLRVVSVAPLPENWVVPIGLVPPRVPMRSWELQAAAREAAQAAEDSRLIALQRREAELVARDRQLTIEREAAAICEPLGVGCAVEAVGHFDPVTFAPELVARVRGAAERLGYSHRDIISGAGHDACWAAKVAPATMVMCPCVDGLSHNEAEEITPDWAEKGANVLLHAVVETAEIVG